MIDPGIKSRLLEMVDADIELLRDDTEQEPGALILESNRLHTLRESLENETASQDVVLSLITELIVWRTGWKW